jgi:RISC-loading complex subunit TARBP2
MAEATETGAGGLIKTPIGYLQEVCSKRGVTPQYDLIATEGHVHEPTFVFRCQAGEFMATGKGKK